MELWAVLAAVVVAAVAVAIAARMRKSSKKGIATLLPAIAAELGGTLSDDEIVLEGARYSVKTGEEGTVVQTLVVETAANLPRFHFVMGGSGAEVEIYPKTEATSEFAAAVKKVLEEEGKTFFMEREWESIALSTGGVCISPKFGMFAGKPNSIYMNIYSAGPSSIFFRALADREGTTTREIGKMVKEALALAKRVAEIGG